MGSKVDQLKREALTKIGNLWEQNIIMKFFRSKVALQPELEVIKKLELEVGENVSVSSVKRDGWVKIPIDAVRLIRQIVKRVFPDAQFGSIDLPSLTLTNNWPNWGVMDLLYWFTVPIWTDRIGWEHCLLAIVGGEATGHYKFNRGFSELAHHEDAINILP